MAHPVKVRTSEGWQDVSKGPTGPPGPPGAGTAPPGVLMPFAGTVAPTGFLFCDGTAISRVTYADLFGVIGTAYGTGDGSTTFNLPNMKGRVPVGLDAAQTEFDARGEIGGAKTHILIASQMPSHTHPIPAEAPGTGYVSGDHSHFYWQPSGYLTGIYTDAYGPNSAILTVAGGNTGGISANHYHGVNSHAHGGATTGAGSDQGHNNLQPYVVVNWIIKT